MQHSKRDFVSSAAGASVVGELEAATVNSDGVLHLTVLQLNTLHIMGLHACQAAVHACSITSQANAIQVALQDFKLLSCYCVQNPWQVSSFPAGGKLCIQ